MPMQKELAAARKFYSLISPKFSRRGTLLFFMLFISSALLLPFPFLTKYLFDNVILNPNKVNAIHDLIAIAAFLIVLQVLDSIFMYYLEIYRTRLDNDISIHLRTLLTEKLAKMREEYFRKTDYGTIFHRYTDDVDESQSVLFEGISFAVIDMAKIIFGIAAMLILSLPMTAIAFLLIPFYVFAVMKTNTELVKSEEEIVKRRGTMYDFFYEYIRSVHLVKTYVLNRFAEGRIERRMEGFSDEVVEYTKTKSMLDQIVEFIGAFGPLLVLVYGVEQIIEGRFTVGALIAFTEFVPYVFEPASGLVEFTVELEKAYPSIRNMYSVLDFDEEIQRGTKFPAVTQHGVVFNNVGYRVGEKTLLQNLSFVIPPASTVAIVGPSGAGKTSILRLIEGFYYPTSGHVLVGGADTLSADIRSIRSDIGYVSQETTLLKGTIRENLALEKRMSLRKIRHFAAIAQVDGVVEKLAKGYESALDPEASSLSGGQLQRLSLARALAQEKKILLLDEFSSEIDPATERKILGSLEQFHGRKTMVIVTHDEHCVKGADLVLVIKGGKLVEQGTYASLSSNPRSAFRKIFGD